jgi:hypothetical protein
MAHAHESTIAGGPGHDQPGGGHENDNVDVRAIFTFCLGLLVTALIVNGMIWLLFQYFASRESMRLSPEYPLAAGQETRVPPEPRLQTNPRGDLQELRAHEDAVLGTYGWVDKGTGVVRIPIDAAMKLTLQRGLPARSGPGDAQK